MTEQAKTEEVKDDEGRPKYYSVQEVADIFRVTMPTVRRWLAEGKMSYIKPAKKMLVPAEDVLSFAQASHGTPEEVASNGNE